MKHALCILLFLCMLTTLAAAAESPEDEAQRCVRVGPIINGFTWVTISEDENGMRGFIIDAYGNRLYEEPYGMSEEYFQEGLVTVRKDGRAGCIDEKGQVVIPFDWDRISSFYHGAAIARRDKQEALISRTGKILTPFTSGTGFLDGFDDILARNPELDLDLFILSHDGKETLYRSTGEELVTVDRVESYAYLDYTRKSESMRLDTDMLRVIDGGKYGYLNQQGEWAIPAQFTSAFPFSDGLAAVQSENGRQYHLIDKQGRTIAELPENYTVQGICCEGKLIVTDARGWWGYAGQSGQVVLPCQWENAGYFSEGRAVVKKDGKYGIIDPAGELITPCKWEWVRLCPDGYAVVKAENNEGVLTRDGQSALPCEYCYLNYLGEDAFSFADHYQIPARSLAEIVANAENYGIINARGEILSPAQWNSVFLLPGDKYIEVFRYGGSVQGKIGYLDHQGRVVVPCEYDHGYFSEGYFTLRKDGYLTILDEQGNRTF